MRKEMENDRKRVRKRESACEFRMREMEKDDKEDGTRQHSIFLPMY